MWIVHFPIFWFAISSFLGWLQSTCQTHWKCLKQACYEEIFKKFSKILLLVNEFRKDCLKPRLPQLFSSVHLAERRLQPETVYTGENRFGKFKKLQNAKYGSRQACDFQTEDNEKCCWRTLTLTTIKSWACCPERAHDRRTARAHETNAQQGQSANSHDEWVNFSDTPTPPKVMMPATRK